MGAAFVADPVVAPFESPLAVAAVDVAIHDLWGKALGVPIHQLYGGGAADAGPGLRLGNDLPRGHPPEGSLDPRGHRTSSSRASERSRCGSGATTPISSCRWLAALREAIPAHVRLSVDAWGSYTLPTALRVGRELGAMGFYWYEEPLPQHGYRGYPELAAALDIALSGGEMLQTRDQFKELFERRAVDIVQPDVSLCGGSRRCCSSPTSPLLYGVRTLPHSWNGAVTEAASLQIAALLPEATMMPGSDVPLLEHDTTENPFVGGGLREPFAFRDGEYELPAGPGLGIELDEEWVRGHAVEPHPPVRLGA